MLAWLRGWLFNAIDLWGYFKVISKDVGSRSGRDLLVLFSLYRDLCRFESSAEINAHGVKYTPVQRKTRACAPHNPTLFFSVCGPVLALYGKANATPGTWVPSLGSQTGVRVRGCVTACPAALGALNAVLLPGCHQPAYKAAGLTLASTTQVLFAE